MPADTNSHLFAVGDRVTVINLRKPGHVRTPDYILGQSGEVVQFCGHFLNPEDLSLGLASGPLVPLYRVQFALSQIWPEQPHHPGDTVSVEIYGHWLRLARAEAT